MTVITISRETGAGGSSVAELVARRLGWEVIDRSIVGELARRLQLPEADIESADEHPTSLVARFMDTLRYLDPPEMSAAWTPPHEDPAFDPRRGIVDRTEELIREAARRGGAVIVGRGAAFVLADHPDSLHVFLYAPEAHRLRMVMDRTGLEEETARRRMRETDANRGAYIRQIYHADWHDVARYHLAINTARVGHGGAADLILSAVRVSGLTSTEGSPSEATGAEASGASLRP